MKEAAVVIPPLVPPVSLHILELVLLSVLSKLILIISFVEMKED